MAFQRSKEENFERWSQDRILRPCHWEPRGAGGRMSLKLAASILWLTLQSCLAAFAPWTVREAPFQVPYPWAIEMPEGILVINQDNSSSSCAWTEDAGETWKTLTPSVWPGTTGFVRDGFLAFATRNHTELAVYRFSDGVTRMFAVPVVRPRAVFAAGGRWTVIGTNKWAAISDGLDPHPDWRLGPMNGLPDNVAEIRMVGREDLAAFVVAEPNGDDPARVTIWGSSGNSVGERLGWYDRKGALEGELILLLCLSASPRVFA